MTAGWDAEAELDLWRSICLEDFYWFVRVAWGIDQQPRKPGVTYWFTPRIHEPICRWFQKHAEEWLRTRRSMNLMLLVPRFFGKTTIITQAGQLWLHVKDTELSTYTGSEAVTQAIEFVEALKKVLDGSDPHAWFTHLYGNGYAPDRRWHKEGTVHAYRQGVGRKEPCLGVWGVEKGLTGKHPDAGFFDDPTSYEAMALHSAWFNIVNDHVASLVPVFADTSLVVWPGTRYGDGDHFGTELRSEGIKTLEGMSMPDFAPKKNGKWHVYYLSARDTHATTDESPAGIPIFPERCSEEFLLEYERKHALRYYAQMLNDPAGSEYNPLTREQVAQCWVSMKDVPRNLRVTLHMDTAFKSIERQARGDNSVIVILGHARDGSGDVYYLEGFGSNIWRMEDYLNKLVTTLQRYRHMGKRITAMTDEHEIGGKGGTWEYAIRSACNSKNVPMPPLLLLARAGKKKVSRIIEAASYWSTGYMHLVEDAPGANELVNEMTRIGNSAHDDWSDAAADGFHRDIYHPPLPVGAPSESEVGGLVGDSVLKDIHLTMEDRLRYYDNAGDNDLCM